MPFWTGVHAAYNRDFATGRWWFDAFAMANLGTIDSVSATTSQHAADILGVAINGSINYKYGMTANDKLSRIDKFVKSKCRNVFRLNGPANLESLNVYTPKKIGELEIVGDSGFASSCFFNKVLNYDDEWKKSINFSDNYDVNKISETKLFSLSNSVTSNTDIVISHYMPDYIKTDDNFSLYDHKLFSSKLKNGAILHCGHVHQKIKKEIKNKNGKFLLINNSIGFPNENLGKLNKNDFLINI